ncbi:MAG TPA: chemotaxis protein CheW [Kofleriaceae bacterium]|nr:chemotaxis protein CheW [Kofleriaceae bacterium]
MSAVGDRAAALRREFDAAFTEPARPLGVDGDDVLAIALAGGRYAIRTAELAAVQACPPITRLPGPVPALLGVVAVHGEVLPVYALAALLGLGPAAPARWIAITHRPAAVALAFDGLDGQRRITPEALVAAPASGPLLDGVVAEPGGPRAMLSITRIVAAIAAREESP